MADQEKPNSRTWTGFGARNQWTGFHDPKDAALAGFDSKVDALRPPPMPSVDRRLPSHGTNARAKASPKKTGRPRSREAGTPGRQVFMHNALLLHEISRLTQRAVAEHTGMSVSTLKRMLNGTHASELDNKRALVQVYCREIGCDLKDIDLDTVELTPAMVEQAKCRR